MSIKALGMYLNFFFFFSYFKTGNHTPLFKIIITALLSKKLITSSVKHILKETNHINYRIHKPLNVAEAGDTVASEISVCLLLCGSVGFWTTAQLFVCLTVP